MDNKKLRHIIREEVKSLIQEQNDREIINNIHDEFNISLDDNLKIDWNAGLEIGGSSISGQMRVYDMRMRNGMHPIVYLMDKDDNIYNVHANQFYEALEDGYIEKVEEGN